MDDISVSRNRTIYNYGYIIPLSSIPEEKREHALTDFSEGSEGLKKCLRVMWNMKLNTIGCRIGDSERYVEGYITMEEGINLFKYLSSSILNDDMVRLWIIPNKELLKSKQVLIFAGTQEEKEDILLRLAEDLLTGEKDNSIQIYNKIGKPFSTSYLLEKREYELRRLNLPEEDIVWDLWDYKQELDAKNVANADGKEIAV